MAKRITQRLVDIDTGELIDTSLLIQMDSGDRVVSKAQQEFLQKQSARYQDKTSFIWLNFQYGTNLEFPVDSAVAVRFLYFGTACGKDGIIQRNKLMNAKLNLDKNQQTAFLKQAQQSGLLRQDGSAYFVNQQIISWGEYSAESNHIRLFANYYRTLCESTHKQADLKRIYYFLQMIPYLNRQTNILSHNPLEQDLERIAYMSFNEFCEKIQYNTAHSAKLKKQLSAFRVHNELILGFFNDLSELTPTGRNVIINPKFCFGGDRSVKKYKDLCALFENEKNIYVSATSKK